MIWFELVMSFQNFDLIGFIVLNWDLNHPIAMPLVDLEMGWDSAFSLTKNI